MYFFVNKGIHQLNSGVEYAQFYRADIFNQQQWPFKFILTDFLPDLDKSIQQMQLKNREIINLYEYFLSEDPVTYLKKGLTVSQAFDQKDYYDDQHHLKLSIIHNTRHYATTLYYHYRIDHGTGKVVHDIDRVILTNGTHRLMWHYQLNKVSGRHATSFRLFDFEGQNYWFQNFEGLLSFFYQKVNETFSNGHYIIDRGVDNQEALIRLKASGAMITITQVIHAQHFFGIKQQQLLFNQHYQYLFDHAKMFDHIITATMGQTQQVIENLQTIGLDHEQTKAMVKTIPAGYARAIKTPRKVHQNVFQFVTASRLHPEKHIDHIIYAIQQLKQNNYSVALTIYGDGDDNQRLKKLILKLNLSDTIHLMPTTHHFLTVLNEYDALVSASYSEGFGLTYLEALSQGLPVVSYANAYGAQHLIKDGVNGYLANVIFSNQSSDIQQNIQNLVQAMVKVMVLNNYPKLSVGAIQTAQQYSSNRVSQKWAELMGVGD